MTSSRQATFQTLASREFDVLVVGGGIVGAGVARDAAQRGLQVALIDRHDFAFGTSSRSSRLLHGGLRYLEQGHIGLVREASREKVILGQIAPNLADPLGFVFPVYRHHGRPLWQLKIGVKLYDLLCSGRNFGPSRGLSVSETLGELRGLETEGLVGSVRYFDALTNDARLVLDTLRSAAAHGAAVANYVSLENAERDSDGTWRTRARDQLTQGEFTLRSKTIVNATGPWAQQIPHSSVKLRLSKGIHIVVDLQRLNVSSPLVLAEGKRILFVIPWGERVIVGTTDTDYSGRPEDVAVDDADISYVLQAVNRSFPSLALVPSDIVGSWAGVRPLIADPHGAPSDVSRAHEIHTPEPGWWDIAGGKLTTYRLMAEQAVDALCRHLGRRRLTCRTASSPLLGAGDRRYSRIVPPPVSRDAVEHFIRNEWAITVDDIVSRRTSWLHYHRDKDGVTAKVKSWMADCLETRPAVR